MKMFRGSFLEVIAVLSSVIVVGLATGLTTPYVSLTLSHAHWSTTIIGVMAAIPSIGILAIVPFINPLTRKYPAKKIFLFATVSSAVSILLLGVTHNLIAWMFFRFVMGVASATLIILGESWVNYIILDKHRGRLIGTYMTAFAICQIMGPSLLAFLGSDGWLPLLVAAGFHLFAFILLLFSECRFSNNPLKSRMSILDFMIAAPVIVSAVLFFSFFDNVILSLLPLYGLFHDFSEKMAVMMVSMIFLGDALLQIPIGWYADHYGRSRLHKMCGATLLLIICALPFLMKYFILWPILILLGGAAGGIYTLGIIRIGDLFKGQALITANASVNLIWGIGSLVGPIISSSMMGLLGPNGLIIMLIIVILFFLACSTRKIVVPA